MTNNEKRDGNDNKSRSTILSRRARFVGLALASAGVAIGSEACVCLSVAPPVTEQRDAGARPCLSEPQVEQDAGAPIPCLSQRPPTERPTEDAGSATPPTEVGSNDAGPVPIACLDPSIPPEACLSLPRKFPFPEKK